MPSVDLTRIGSNIGAMYSLQSLMNINNKLATAQQRLATGKRLNSAMDDPAGLTIATKMQARSVGLGIAMDNISDAKNMLSVAESGMSKLTDILSTMRSKAQQAASDTLGGTERDTITTQLKQFAVQIDDLIEQTKWNDVSLLDGTVTGMQFQTGVDLNEDIHWSMTEDLSAEGLDVSTNTSLAATDTVTFLSGGTGGIAAIDSSATTTHSLSAAETGTYSVKVVGIATSATQGKLDLGAGVKTLDPTDTISTVDLNGVTTTKELASGTYTFEVTNVTDATTTGHTLINYEVRDAADNVVASKINADLDGVTTINLKNGVEDIGIKFNFSDVVTMASTDDKSVSFEYIASNSAKYELRNGSNGLMTVDTNSSILASGKRQAIAADVPSTGEAGYYQMSSGGTVQTGRGIEFTIDDFAGTLLEDTAKYSILKAGSDYEIDVSSATKAATYMDKVNSAMDAVNSVLSDLGSLMARMTIKEEAAGSARINVEAAYNRIMNANMAEEQVNASKYMVLQQTAVAMLAQANQAPQFLLSLFK